MQLIDTHVHTVLCKHAEGDPSEYVAAASRLGLSGIAFTDHAPAPGGYDLKHRMLLQEFDDYRRMCEREKSSRTEIEVLWGIEADFYEGCLSFLPRWLADQSFDVVLGSVHYIDGWGFDNPDNIEVWNSVDIADVWRKYFERVGMLVDTHLFDIVAHIDLPKKFGHRPSDKVVSELTKPILDKIAKAGMAIELNTSGLRRPVREIYPSALILGLAMERNIPICFGSDAHSPSEVGWGFDAARKSAIEAGYKEWVVFRHRRVERLPLQPYETSTSRGLGRPT